MLFGTAPAVPALHMRLGSDEVNLDGEILIIQAAAPMDWPIREFCKIPILFEGQKYYLRSKRKAEQPRRMIYELCPWPPNLHDASPTQVVYDERYVVERDRTAAENRRHDRLYLALLPLYPFLGLFWSGLKERVLVPVGFEPGSLTKASIFLTFNVFICEAIFVGWLRGGILAHFLSQSALRPVDWILLLSMGADSVMRFSQSQKLDVTHHWGFFEWLRFPHAD